MSTPINEKEAFKLGFAKRCAELNMDLDQTMDLARKGTEKKAIWDFLGNIAGLSTAVAAGAPLAGGYGLGYALAKARDADTDVEDLKNDELIGEYRRLAAAARRVAERKKRQLIGS